jgi:hypothetical protein
MRSARSRTSDKLQTQGEEMYRSATEAVGEIPAEDHCVQTYARIHKLSASEERQLKLLFGDRATRHEIECNTERRSRVR